MPVFFVAIGLAADLRRSVRSSHSRWRLLVVAVVGKLIGSGVGAALAGIGVARESSLVGIGMIARGEVALVAATVGLRSGAIDDDLRRDRPGQSLGTTIIAPVGIALWPCRVRRRCRRRRSAWAIHAGSRHDLRER